MAISGVRSVPKNTNSATTLKNSPAQFVHAYAIHITALYAVRHILKIVPKVSERLRVRTRFIPKIAPPVRIGEHFDVSEISKISFRRRNEKGHRKIAPRVGMLLGTTLTFLVGRMTRTPNFLFANVQKWSGKIPILHRLRVEFIFYRLFVCGLYILTSCFATQMASTRI
jgi:hypothetical protein